MYFETGSLRMSLPSSISIRMATAVTGLVIDAMWNKVSVRIALFDSRSISPWASRCTSLPFRITRVTAPAKSLASMWLWITEWIRFRRSEESPASSGLESVRDSDEARETRSAQNSTASTAFGVIFIADSRLLQKIVIREGSLDFRENPARNLFYSLAGFAGRSHTTRASGLAAATRQEFLCAFQQARRQFEQRSALADPAGIVVVQIKIRLVGSSRDVFGDGNAQVVRIAHHQQRSDGFQQRADADQAVLFVGRRQIGQKARREVQPERSGVHLLLGHREISGAHVFHGVELHFLEPDNLAIQTDIAVSSASHSDVARLEFFELLHLRVVDRVGEVIRIDRPDVSFAALVVEALHLILTGFMKIDRFFVQRGEGGGERDFGNDLVITRDVHDDEIVAGDRTEADRVGGIGVGSPVPGRAGAVQKI